MKRNQFMNTWKSEAEKAFVGWDFSYLAGRVIKDPLPWDYQAVVLDYMKEAERILDMGTGGGEFLLSLNPPWGRTYATEAYPPNYELCANTLPAHGIDVRQVFSQDQLPFDSSFFDLVINRQAAYSAKELYRVLKPGGSFVTQQVGGMNNRELAGFLLGSSTAEIAPDFSLAWNVEELKQAGFTISVSEECFPYARFRDIGALVYLASIIEWEFPGFSVDHCFGQLCQLQQELERRGYVESREHRFMIIAKK